MRMLIFTISVLTPVAGFFIGANTDSLIEGLLIFLASLIPLILFVEAHT